jgi:hypothetical protein
MSASERLREIDGKFELMRTDDLPPTVIRLKFWDELVAVVEAAEELDAGVDLPDGEPSTVEERKLRAALAALEAKLEQK